MKKCDCCVIGLHFLEFEGSYEVFEDYNFIDVIKDEIIFYNFCPYCGYKFKSI